MNKHEPWVLPHMDEKPNDTVRSFPRTMNGTHSAFKDAAYASPLDVSDPGADSWFWATVCICLIGLVSAILWAFGVFQ